MKKFTLLDFKNAKEIKDFLNSYNVENLDDIPFKTLKDAYYIALLKIMFSKSFDYVPFAIFEYNLEIDKSLSREITKNIDELLFKLVVSWYKENDDNKDMLIFAYVMTIITDSEIN